MDVILTRLVSLIVSICLLATASTAASMRSDQSQDQSTGQFAVLCLNGHEQVVEIGRDGAPIKRAHHCPDCTTLAGTAPPLQTYPAMSELEGGLTASALRISQMHLAAVSPTARAPPISVFEATTQLQKPKNRSD